MSKLTATEVKSKCKSGSGKYSDGNGLYFVVPKSGQPFWMLRYTADKRRKEMTLGSYSTVSLAEARSMAAEYKHNIAKGIDPLVVRKREQQAEFITVDDLAKDWLLSLQNRLKHPTIPARIYKNEICPHIGGMKLEQVNARDVRHIIQTVARSERPSIANDTLMYCKQLFNHGIKLDVVANNPASAFSVIDAGGVESSKERALSVVEIKKVFEVFRNNQDSFSRENYLAVALLLALSVRKSELIQAKWAEFELEKGLWHLPKERSKSNANEC